MEGSIIVFTMEIFFMLLICVVLFMLFYWERFVHSFKYGEIVYVFQI